MTPSQGASPLGSPHYADTDSIVFPRQRRSPLSSLTSLPASLTSLPSSLTTNLPYRRSNPSLSSLFAATSSLPASRPSSGTVTPPVVAGSVFSPGATNRTPSPVGALTSDDDEARTLIQRAFVPHVGVLASADTDEIVQQKGFPGGFLELIRPFGETTQGKVTIRDSTGVSKSWDDFGIRFTGLRDGISSVRQSTDSGRDAANGQEGSARSSGAWQRTGGDLGGVEEVVDRHLSYYEYQPEHTETDYLNHKSPSPQALGVASPFYSLYLRRLLSGLPMSPHETFSHPVACVIAISSRTPSPIEELRRLYGSTNTGEHRLPQWVNNEYLRYYVLVHDEDHDDIAKSTTLYEQMKRHFGLHCHLLRLRSSQCVPSDDDSIRLPVCEWISASEELAEIQKRESADDVEDPTPCLFESDASAIRSFVREFVTQSIIPSMERLSATWNEQVASRRRGISGRFMSLSKRWTPFGSSSRTSSGPAGLQSGSGSNYDALQGFYRPDTPEAIMRKLADYAFMLRDFKLAQSTYDILRTDFNNDKAWKYYAGANEMAAISTLLNSQTLTSKTRTEAVDQMLETASYSYITRCIAPYYALRTLTLGVELLKLRGSSAIDDAARWASRILENGLVGPVGHTLFTERVSACYTSRKGVGSMNWGSRRRKAALWAILATEGWLRLGKIVQAEKCLQEASRLYDISGTQQHALSFHEMQGFMEELREVVAASRRKAQGYDGAAEQVEDEVALVEEVSEQLDSRPQRRSLVGTGTAPFSSQDLGPLSPVRRTEDEPGFRDDKFE